MSFMENLANNPKGSSIYGQPGMGNDEDTMSIVHRLKDRELSDFKDKANFMSDLSLKQERARSMYNSDHPQLNQNQEQNQPMNTVMGFDPNRISAYERGELGLKQQGLGLESQRIIQTGKLGQEGLDIKAQQEKLNQQKNDQINAQKQADMQRKIDDSEKKFAAIQAELERKTKAGEDTLQLHKDAAEAVKERHQLEMDRMKHDIQLKDDQFNELKKQHDEVLKQRGRTKTTTELNADGTKKTTTTERGDASDTVNVIGKDGKSYTIPKDKLNDMDADGTPHWKPVESEE